MRVRTPHPNPSADTARRPTRRDTAWRQARRRARANRPGPATSAAGTLAAASLAVPLVAVLLLVGAGPAVAHAAEPAIRVLAQGQTGGQVQQLIERATTWLTALLAALATLFLTLGGIRYILANGNPSEVEHAKQAFRSAGIGYALAALAPLIVNILTELVAR
ncbi:MAG TPA: pilin [Pseudonocardiaceae bacterium]|nr:pilin [Pseudonocardiaceae bacterium]